MKEKKKFPPHAAAAFFFLVSRTEEDRRKTKGFVRKVETDIKCPHFSSALCVERTTFYAICCIKLENNEKRKLFGVTK